MSIDWSKAPEGATHATPSGTFIREERGDRFVAYWEWLYEWVLIESGLEKDQLIERPKNPLTQAVFDGLPPEYRWAGVEASGKAYACICELIPKQTWLFAKDAKSAIRFVGDGYDTTDWQNSLIERQEVSNRVEQLRSVEAARKHSHYFKDVSGVDKIDVYAVLRLFEVTDPCLQHIVKKALCAGKRGAKDWAKDVQEIADTAQRLIELESAK